MLPYPEKLQGKKEANKQSCWESSEEVAIGIWDNDDSFSLKTIVN